MKLGQFLTTVTQGELHTVPVVVFSAKQYPALFFSHLLTRLRSYDHGRILKTVPVDQMSSQALQAQLATSFLGRSDLLWLGDLSSLESTAVKKQILTLVGSYQGPHNLMAFIQADEKNVPAQTAISLDADFSESERRALVAFLFPQQSAVQTVEVMIKGIRLSSLDQLLAVAQYGGVVGKNVPLFTQQWLRKIVAPEASLFDLSGYFFGRKTEQFWNCWAALKDEYAAPFWTTYWSEQLWRAHYVIKLYKENRITEAKQLSYRLPFSFLQRDWKQLSAEELQRAHQFLYEGDHAFKNGASEFFLEVFYATFLAKQI